MDELSRAALIGCRNEIRHDLKVEYVVSYLIGEGILTDEDVEVINYEKTSPQRVDKLLDTLPSKGPDAFDAFVDALTEAEYEHLADGLMRRKSNPTRKRHFSVGQVQSILIAGGVPPRPNVFASRPDYIRRIHAGLSEIVDDSGGWVVVHGMGGSGKSVLAADSVRDATILSQFPGGVFWVSIGKIDNAKLLMKMQNLCAMLDRGHGATPPRNIEEAKDRLRLAIHQQYPYSLLVLDDVWSQQVAKAFDIQARVMVTTRDEDVCKRVGGHVHKIHIDRGLDKDQALQILSEWTQIPVSQLPPEAEEIYNVCQGMPLAISIIGSMLEEHDNRWQYYLTLLRRRKTQRILSESSYKYATINEAIGISVNNLYDDVREFYQDFAMFDSDHRVPTMVFCILWSEEKEFVEDRMDSLVKKSLVTKEWDKQNDTYIYSVHGLQLDYLKTACTDLQALHRKLVMKYKQKCGGEYHLLPNDGYMHWFICYHMMKADLLSELPSILLDLKYIDAKIQVTGAADLINDYIKYGALLDIRYDIVREEFAHFVSSNAYRYATEVPDIIQLALSSPSGSAVYKQALNLAKQNKCTEHLYLDWCNRDFAQSPVFLVTKLHNSPVKSVQFSYNSHAVLSSSEEDIKVFDRATGKELLSLEAHDETINCCRFSHDSSHIISCSDDKTVKIFRVPETLLATPSPPIQPNGYGETPTPRLKYTKWHPTFSTSDSSSDLVSRLLVKEIALDSEVKTCAISHDDKRVLVGCQNGDVVMLSMETGAELLRLEAAHDALICAVDFSSSGRYFATCGYDRMVKLWQTDSGEEVYLSAPYRSQLTDCKFIPNTHKLAYCCDNEIHICDPSAGICSSVMTVKAETVILSMAIAEDGILLAAGLSNFAVQLFNLVTKKPMIELKGNSGWVECVAFSPDCKQLVSGGSDETVTIWNAEVTNGQKCVSFKKDFDVNFSQDQIIIAAVDTENRIQVLEGEEGKMLFNTAAESSRIRSVAITSDCSRIAYGQESGIVKVAHMVDKKLGKVDVCSGHSNTVRYLCFSTDDQILASCSDDSTIKLWNVNGECMVTCSGHKADVRHCHFFDNNTKLVSSSFDSTMKVWDVATGNELAQTAGHSNDWVLASDVSPDGTKMVSASVDRTLKVWSVADGSLLNTLTSHHDCVRSCAFSSAGRFIVSGDDEGLVRIWSEDGAACNKFPRLHNGWVTDVKISPDDQTVVSVSDNLRWWDVNSHKLLQTFYIHGSFCKQVKSSADFKRFVTIDSPGTMYILKSIE
ncbi:apoptotic protease-activating factor 1-like [Tubulanus polymorphus]|uniref:apoptotic protease-activating factor 1-like n=1 Tax=Tubulanus polymorphus TaxID=672921 RepID=UPI003DA367E5